MTQAETFKRLLATEADIHVDTYFRFDLSRAEAAILATSPMQRLRRLRQTGLGYFDNVCAEHSRFPHSIGTVYWACRMLDGLISQNNPDAQANAVAITRLDDLLATEGLSFALLMRVFALIHDVALLPLGHTMRFQLNQMYDRSTFGVSMHRQLSQIVTEINAGMHRLSADEQTALKRHLAYAGCVANVPRLLRREPVRFVEDVDKGELVTESAICAIPALTAIYDIVHGVYSADLIEICVRDLGPAGTTWRMPVSVLEAGRLFLAEQGMETYPGAPTSPVSSIWRYGIGQGEVGRETDAIRDLAMVHMTRVEIAARAFYGPRKCIADAMLDKAIRLILNAAPEALSVAAYSVENRLTIGDDDFLDLLLATAANHNVPQAQRVLRGLRSGQLFAPILHVVASVDPASVEALGKATETPDQRLSLEQALADRLPNLDAAEIVAISTPEKMQSKVANTPVLDAAGRWRAFDEVCRDEGIHPEIVALPGAYKRLRSAGVYVMPRADVDTSNLRTAVRAALADIGINVPVAVPKSAPESV